MKPLSRRSFLKLSGAAALGAALSGCAAGDNTVPAPVTDDFDVHSPFVRTDKVSSEIVCAISIDGGSAFYGSGNRISWGEGINPIYSIFQSYGSIAPDGSFYNQLLKDIKIIDEKNALLFFWDCIYDTEGNKINADDIIFCTERILINDPSTVRPLDHVEKTGEYSVQWVCSTPFKTGELEKSLSNVMLFSQKAYEALEDAENSAPVGTGPYKLRSYTPGSELVLTANDSFWANALPADNQEKLWVYDAQFTRQITYKIIPDAAARATALSTGIVDMADFLNSSDIDALQKSGIAIRRIEQPQTAPVAFVYNCSDRSACFDINLRKAIAYGIDNAAVASGADTPAQEVFGILPRQLDAPDSWREGRDYYAYDPEKARELLVASSYQGQPLRVFYEANEMLDHAVMAMQASLRDIGIIIEPIMMGFNEMIDGSTLADNWDIRFMTLGGGDYLSQTARRFLSAFAGSGYRKGENICCVNDPHHEELLYAMLNDNSPENIAAWDQYFTYDKCYGYALFGYSLCAAVQGNITPALGTRYALVPGACIKN